MGDAGHRVASREVCNEVQGLPVSAFALRMEPDAFSENGVAQGKIEQESYCFTQYGGVTAGHSLNECLKIRQGGGREKI